MKTNALFATAGGIIGGVVVAVAIAVLGVGETTTTTTVAAGQPAGFGHRAAVADSGGGLTAREIYKRDAPGVVFIKANVVQKSTDPFGFSQDQSGTATGSGFVISDKGLILTNAHVVNGASSIQVQFGNKRTAQAQVLGRDESTDIALLKVDPSNLDLHPLKMGNSNFLQVGDPTLAIGNPFGLERTLTTGVVSAVKRTIGAPNGFQIDGVIQTDAAINPGNSGGPLLNSKGEVVGINSQIQTGNGGNGNVGIGFAVPINTAKQILPDLEQGKRVQRGWLGVETATVDASLSMLKLPADYGALVQKVVPGSPAAKAGIRGGNSQVTVDGSTIAVGGDLIVEVNGESVRASDDLQRVVGRAKPGDTVEFKVLRGESQKEIEVTLGTRPESAKR